MKRIFTVLAFFSLLSGCTNAFHVNPIVKPLNTSEGSLGFEYDTQREPFDYGRDCLPGLGGETGDDGEFKCTKPAVEEIEELRKNSIEEARYGRNRLQDYLFYLSNDVCDIHKAAMFANINTPNLILDVAAVGLGAASTIVTATDGTRILAGLAAAATGTRATFNENLVQNQFVSVITKAIDESRNELRVDLAPRRMDPITTYTVENAVADAIRYHERCSLYHGLAALDDAIEEIAPNREQYLERVEDLAEFNNRFRYVLAGEATPEQQAQLDAGEKLVDDEMERARVAAD